MSKFVYPKFIQVGGNKLDIGQFSAPAVADCNGDGKKDLILGEGTYSANSVYVYLNKGTSSYPKFDENGRLYLAYGEGTMNLSPSVVDWDKDGDLDLVVGDGNGFLNLYINEAGKRKVKPLGFAGRLKKRSGGYIDVGSAATPCVTDWDEDGDWDIVCGNSYGAIYLILNEGTLENPQFTDKSVLKGTNVLKGKGINGWSSDQERQGAYSITTDDTAPNSGTRCLKVVCHEGYEGTVVVSGRITQSLERNVRYTVTFFVKGRDFKGSWGVGYPQVTDRTVADGVRTHVALEGAWKESGEFVAGGTWKKISRTFKLPKAPKTKDAEVLKKVGEKKACTFSLVLSGDGTLWVDDVSLELKQ